MMILVIAMGHMMLISYNGMAKWQGIPGVLFEVMECCFCEGWTCQGWDLGHGEYK